MNYIDPSGHASICMDGEDVCYDQEKRQWRGDINWGLWGPTKHIDRKKLIKENAEELGEIGKTVTSVLIEPADWAITINDCINGDCSWLSLGFMVIPGLSGRAGKILYRGLDAGHPGIKVFDAFNEVHPRGGDADIYEHIYGFTDSNYTSWTEEFFIAKTYAEKGGDGGIVLRIDLSDIDNYSINVQELGRASESDLEWLIRGIIRTADKIWP
jgi:hypothetical protein